MADESASDGSWKGLQTNVQGIDLSGRDRFVLHHHRPLGVGRSRFNDVVVVPRVGLAVSDAQRGGAALVRAPLPT